MGKPERTGIMRMDGELLNAVFASGTCGCEITGDGTLRHPLRIDFCPRHAAASDLLEACEAALSTLETISRIGCVRGAGVRMVEVESQTLKAAIAKAMPYHATRARRNG